MLKAIHINIFKGFNKKNKATSKEGSSSTPYLIRNKHSIVLFFVALFLLFKVAGLHALSHDADDIDVQHCDVCHIAVIANFIPLIEAQNLVLKQLEYCFYEKKINSISSYIEFKNNYLSNYLFTWPPPVFS